MAKPNPPPKPDPIDFGPLMKRFDALDQAVAKIQAVDFGPVLKRFDVVDASIKRIIKKEAQIMSQLDDLNAAISAEDVEVQDLLLSVTKIGTDIDTLLAKIAAGGVPTDLTTQLAAIQSHVASLTTAAQQLKDSDTKANA